LQKAYAEKLLGVFKNKYALDSYVIVSVGLQAALSG
jgi:hypothetical protein